MTPKVGSRSMLWRKEGGRKRFGGGGGGGGGGWKRNRERMAEEGINIRMLLIKLLVSSHRE